MSAARNETLSSVERALTLMEVLSSEDSLTLTQLAERLQSGKTTVFRLAATLAERDWIVKDENLRYNLGPAALALGMSRAGSLDLKTLLLPIMIELHDETEETIHLTRLEGRYIVYRHQLLSPKPVVSLATLGGRSPAHCVSPGLAQLAALTDSRIDWILDAPLVAYTDKSLTDPDLVRQEIEQVRRRGYGINFGSFRSDVGGVGVAIRNGHGEPIAGLSICVPVFRLRGMDLERLGLRLLRAARDAEQVINTRAATPRKTGAHNVKR
ncbi:IclR family transcriptional regulator [Oceaniradius stylonematis]|uniref:IclR family transcriptional regulator n=1 Tax=Oceaniradius stylonematis TaxID=2184161 RepID=UPI00273D9D2D|nr:IclR family transcriptional regulator [Oceaniradius stylonematis]